MLCLTYGSQDVQALLEVYVPSIVEVIVHQHMLRPVCLVLVVVIQGSVLQ